MAHLNPTTVHGLLHVTDSIYIAKQKYDAIVYENSTINFGDETVPAMLRGSTASVVSKTGTASVEAATEVSVKSKNGNTTITSSKAINATAETTANVSGKTGATLSGGTNATVEAKNGAATIKATEKDELDAPRIVIGNYETNYGSDIPDFAAEEGAVYFRILDLGQSQGVYDDADIVKY